jgi:hypothetical protein
VEVYEGDIRCEHCLREAMEGVDRILFLAIGMKVSTDEQVISRAAKSSGIHHVRKLLLLNDELVDLVRVNFEIDKAR